MMQPCVEQEHSPKMRASSEDYLEALLMLRQERTTIRAVDLARHMGFSKPSITWAVNHLREGGYILLDSERHIHLTETGLEIAERVYERHRFFHQLLLDAGVDSQQAETEACGIEHAISQESFELLRAYLMREGCACGGRSSQGDYEESALSSA